MGRILKGFWKCNYCKTADIDGLVDECPNCGRRKPNNVKYYLGEEKIEVSAEELHKAGISMEECDGKHKEWICNYCEQINNWADIECSACGSPKNIATHEYGQSKIIMPKSFIEASAEKEDFPTPTYEPTPTNSDFCNSVPEDNYKKKDGIKNSILGFIGNMHGDQILKGIFVLFLIGIFLFFLWPIKSEVFVTGFSWERTVVIEEERTVKENDWSVPSGGRVYDEKWEFKYYRDVLDHYETVTETKSRQVLDHYDTSYSYRDNGNGTFTEISHQTPVYRTEYYTETHQKPVYRKEAVYDTMYYYEIEKWFDVKNYDSSGYDQKPYWNENYVLKENERDNKRYEDYAVHYDDNTTEYVSFEEWKDLKVGDGFVLTRNRLGLTYKRDDIIKE